MWQFNIVVGRYRIDQHLEFEGFFTEGLNPHAGRSFASITETHNDLITLAQKSPHHLNVKGLIPGTDIALHIVLDI